VAGEFLKEKRLLKEKRAPPQEKRLPGVESLRKTSSTNTCSLTGIALRQ